MSVSVEQALHKAKRHAKKGETELAVQHYQSVLEKYPQNLQAIAGLKTLQNREAPQEQTNELINLFNQGRLQQALAYGEALEKQFPNMLLIQNLLAAANAGLGRFEQAAARYARAAQIDPKDANIHNNLGISLNNIGNTDQAVASFANAVHIKPKFMEAHNNLGNGLKDLGRLEEAVASYQNALQIKPNYIDALNNMGVVLQKLGKTEEAVACYKKALEIDPHNARIHNNLALGLHELGRIKKAFSHFQQSVSFAPDQKELWQNFSGLLSTLTLDAYDEQWANSLLTLLDQKTIVRPVQVARTTCNLLKQHPSMQKALQLTNSNDIQKQLFETCDDLADIPLFIRIVELSPILDLHLEKLLKELRRALLLVGDETDDKTGVFNFQLSLALHCFTNEYVFGETDEETAAVQALEAKIQQQLAHGANPSPSSIACLASYRPLHSFEWAHNFSVPETLETLFKQQVNQVHEEEEIRTTIQTLGEIDDQVSRAVRTQYEENPYPRWINTALFAKHMTLFEAANRLNLKLEGNAENFTDSPEILIAGCGTGQQALGTATKFLNSKVLAIDLSLSSLSYAIRKTNELGINNIEYLQADILDLDTMDKQFDLVESSGVLHHMADPMAGWRILTDRLKPGGLMKIALYSELARKSVVAARALISEMGLSQTTRDILKFRAAVLDPDGEIFSKIGDITSFKDFFSTSELRDLLFHVQEHRFTIPQIKQNLEELNLTFAGFEFMDGNIFKKFKQLYPEPQSVYDLDAWHEFEQQNVNTFAGMYQFWMQKKVNL